MSSVTRLSTEAEIKNVRIYLPAAGAGDTARESEPRDAERQNKRGSYKNDWWLDMLGPWVESIAIGKEPLPISLDKAHYCWLKFHKIKKGDADWRSVNAFKGKLSELFPTMYQKIKAKIGS